MSTRTDPSRNGVARRRRDALIRLLVLLLLFAGAIAYLNRGSPDDTSGPTVIGSGPGSGGSATGLVVVTFPATGDKLEPGGGPQTIAFSVTNRSTARQVLASVDVTIANADGTAWRSRGCSADDYAVSAPAIGYGPIEPAGVAAGSVQILMKNLSKNQDYCKNTLIPLLVVAS